MMSRVQAIGWKRAAVTAIAAYALVVQALLLSFGGALHAAPADAPQGILCSWDSKLAPNDKPVPDEPSPAKPHDGLCCILGCGHSAGAAGLAPAAAEIERPLPVLVVAGLSREAPFLRLASNVLPVGSRAPPRLG